MTVATSILVYGGLLQGYWIMFHPPWIFKFPMPEIWRFVSAFWLTGPQIGVLFDSYFSMPFYYTYKSPLTIKNSVDLFERARERICQVYAPW